MPSLRTRLYDVHASSGATFIEFGGWEMPLRYVGILAEHAAVRRDAGLFDVSHMGKTMIWGPTAWSFLDRLSANDIPRKPFRARYTHLLDDDGRIIDDVIVTCLAPDRYFMVCNAGPRPRVLEWLRMHRAGEHIQDVTQDYLCLALQGPKAARILQILTAYNLETNKPFTGAFVHLLLSERLGTSRPPTPRPPEAVGWGPSTPEGGDYCLVTRTGYTGEDGFELFPANDVGLVLWKTLLAAGREAGLRPVGLGARDTLRLEKGYLLSGTDFDGTRTPLEASSEWLVKWDHDFVGRDALLRQEERGDYDRLVGLLAEDRGVPRHGCEVYKGDRRVGIVTSGTMSPILRAGVALAYVRPEASPEGTSLSILVRDRRVPAHVKRPPFV